MRHLDKNPQNDPQAKPISDLLKSNPLGLWNGDYRSKHFNSMAGYSKDFKKK